MHSGRRFISLSLLMCLLGLLAGCGKSSCGGDSFNSTGTSTTSGGTDGGGSNVCGSSTTGGGTTGNSTVLDYLYVVDNTDIVADSFNGTSLQSISGFSSPSLGAGAVANMVIVNKKFLYQPWAPASGGSEIQAFTIGSTGALTTVAGSPFTTGAVSDALATNPSGSLLFAGQSGTQALGVFQINSSTGALTAAPGSPYTLPVAAAQLVVDESGQFLYAVANKGSGIVYGFSINPTTGALTELADSPFFVFVSRLAASPTAEYLMGAGGGNIYTIPIDSSGNLSVSATYTPANAPNQILIHPNGKFMYTFSETVSPIEGYALDSSANVTQLSGSPFTSLTQMNDAVMDQTGTAMIGLTASQQFYVVVINPTTGALTAPSPVFTGFASNYFAIIN